MMRLNEENSYNLMLASIRMNLKFLFPNKTISEVSLSDKFKLDSACYNSKTGNFMLGLTNEEGKSEIHIYEPNGKLISRIDSFRVWDCVWNEKNDTLLISNGNTFYSLPNGDIKPEKIIKFNHIKYAPNSCSLSPSSKYIGILKYRASSDRFHFIDVEKKQLVDAKLICCFYSWINDTTIAYSTISGKIGYYDLEERKKSASPHNIKSILKSKHPSLTKLQESIKKVEKKQQAWIHFDDPIVIEQTLYFVINSGNFFGSALIKYDNSDYELLFNSNDRIQTYDLDDSLDARINMARVIDMKWSYYSLVQQNERFEKSGYDYYLNNCNRMNQCIKLTRHIARL